MSGPCASIHAIVGHLAAALRGIAPAAEAAGIPWREAEAYDEWDSMATQLFDVFVRRSIVEAVAHAPLQPLPLPPYDLRIESYEGYSAIVVDGGGPVRFLFNRLLPGEGDFGLVEGLPVDGAWRSLDQPPRVRPLTDASLQLLRRYPDRSTEVVETLARN